MCYTGARQLHEILNALLANGFDPAEPAAIIYDGTLPTQRTTDGTLQELADMKNLRTKSGHSRRRARGRAAPALALVRRASALRQEALS